MPVTLYLLRKKKLLFEIFSYLKFFHQIALRFVKLSNLTKNGILRNFDVRARPYKSDIFRDKAVENSRISGNMELQVHESATAVTRNVSDFRVDHGYQSSLECHF